MKEPDYTMMMMATYGTLQPVEKGGTKRDYVNPITRLKTTKYFKYTVPFFNHFKYRHQVDDHNGKRHAPISVEKQIGSRRWDLRQFFFILALTDVNVKLGCNDMIDDNDNQDNSMIAHRKHLARVLINNSWLKEEREQEEQLNSSKRTSHRNNRCIHKLIQHDPFTGKYDAKTRKFTRTNKKYSVLRCSVCQVDTRFYCQCNAAVPLCKVCFGIHCVDG
jgi:hypothetical protein